MKAIGLFALLVIASSVHAHSLANQRECIDGSRWKNDCNWCSCHNGFAACTLMACAPGEVSNGPQCEPGSRWKADCNWCSCTETGLGLCTLRACSPPRPAPPVEQPQEELPDDAECTEGSRWRNDCNWCFCANGRGACTQKFCLPGGQSNERQCEPGSRWKADCNWCTCTETGVGACTLRACFPPRPTPPVEQPQEELPDDAECTEGSRWRNDCNWCFCANGRGACTEKACHPEEQSTEPQCEAGSRWKMDCNWCTCSDNGNAGCTYKGCFPPGPTPPVEQPQKELSDDAECTEGSRWRDDCNWCSCANGRGVCTKKACPPEEQSTEPQCEAGSRWKNDCNWCTCSDNGNAGCTYKGCFPPGPGGFFGRTPYGKSMTSAQPQCAEGSSWAEDCNQCRCSNGLKLCTKKICFAPGTGKGQTTPSGGENRCLKPKDAGPCFASFQMFRYNSDTKQCETFLYGGCGGNDNRFETPELCYQACGQGVPVPDRVCDRTQCPEYRETAFRAVLGCSPVYEGGSCCATSYFCTDTRAVSVSEGQCEYHGRLYNVGDDVPVTEVCSICRCSPGGKIDCIGIECPSLFRPPTPGCRSLYREGECCEYKEECGGTTTSQVTCESEGKTYKEGDKMFFDNHGCQRCLCGADYTGPYGAGCSNIDCGYDFRYLDRIQRGCVPLYYKESCCPITFICPGDSRIANDQSQANPQGLTENVCSFNGQNVAVGRELATVEAKVTCSCQTPPHVTCVQTSN